MQPDIRSEIERIMPDLRVLTKAEVEAIAETQLTQWTNTLQFLIMNYVNSASKYALKTRCFASNNGLEPFMCSFGEPDFSEVVPSDCVTSIRETHFPYHFKN